MWNTIWNYHSSTAKIFGSIFLGFMIPGTLFGLVLYVYLLKKIWKKPELKEAVKDNIEKALTPQQVIYKLKW